LIDTGTDHFGAVVGNNCAIGTSVIILPGSFITGRRQSELDTAVKQIGKNVTGVQGDVSNLKDLDRLYDTVKQQKGRIDWGLNTSRGFSLM
jgi:NADP-dependent 3-hydroxy acid dehydrogenase YdfG